MGESVILDCPGCRASAIELDCQLCANEGILVVDARTAAIVAAARRDAADADRAHGEALRELAGLRTTVRAQQSQIATLEAALEAERARSRQEGNRTA